MRCLSCNAALTDFEATRKTLKTEEYLDLCNSCYATIRDDVITIDRSDLEEEDCRQDDDDYSDRCVDHSLDVDI
jgi:peptide deformylase